MRLNNSEDSAHSVRLRSELKAHARGELIGHYSILTYARVLYLILALLFGSIFTLTENSWLHIFIALAGNLVIHLFLMIIIAGFFYMYLQIARGNDIHVSDMMYGFKTGADVLILINLRLIINMLISGIFWGAIWFMIRRLNIFHAESELFGAVLWMLCFACLALVWIICTVILSLPYALVYYLHMDYPDWSASAVLQESKARMSGYKKQVFHLLLSFIGYFVLSVLSLGIGLFWALPYAGMTLTEFYLEISARPADSMDY